MIQGTASGVGKSVLATAFCRLFARAGHRVAPFKSQNMSLNAAVTVDGGEIGRAQAAQAEAAGIEPTVDMNPILLKPETDERSQVVVRGAPLASVGFREYARLRPTLAPIVAGCLRRLRRDHDLVVIEGAGSPAEINLRDTELVNMAVARRADARVLLVGDIDRGGVFAALVGTLTLLPAADRARVAGLLVNKFRGDPSLLGPGLEELSVRTGVPVLGVVPFVADTLVASEDSLDLDAPARPGRGQIVDVAVARLPRIANFDEFEPLAREPGVRVRFVRAPSELDGADLIVLPGSKSTIADLGWLRESGLAAAIVGAAGEGRPVLGVCGGYQMLGETLEDPHRVESEVTSAIGLGLLPVATTFARTKRTTRVSARVRSARGLLADARGLEVAAYEIHTGRTVPRDARRRRPFTVLARGGVAVSDEEGGLDATGAILGTYLHGLLANDALRQALLGHLARRRGATPDPRWGALPSPADGYDRLADIVGGAVDLAAIARLVGLTLPEA
jgi:adenosylcobyric acid synthase